jgi:hypothetical protein
MGGKGDARDAGGRVPLSPLWSSVRGVCLLGSVGGVQIPTQGVDVSMTELRPMVLGYVRADALTTDRELARSTAELATFAYHEGYTLGTVFIERTEKMPAAFEALMAEADRISVDAVVMPGPPPKVVICAHARQPNQPESSEVASAR